MVLRLREKGGEREGGFDEGRWAALYGRKALDDVLIQPLISGQVSLFVFLWLFPGLRGALSSTRGPKKTHILCRKIAPLSVPCVCLACLFRSQNKCYDARKQLSARQTEGSLSNAHDAVSVNASVQIHNDVYGGHENLGRDEDNDCEEASGQQRSRGKGLDRVGRATTRGDTHRSILASRRGRGSAGL